MPRSSSTDILVIPRLINRYAQTVKYLIAFYCAITPWAYVNDMHFATPGHTRTQRSATQLNPNQRNATQPKSTQRNATQRNTTQCNSTQRNSVQLNATQRNATQLNSTQLNSAQLNSTQLN